MKGCENMEIIMPRGDIRQVMFSAQGDDQDAAVCDFDEIYFTVKHAYTDRMYLFQKKLSTGGIRLTDDGYYQFTIQPKDTDRLPFGDYIFDIEVVRGNDIKQTFIGHLKLTEEVTYSENER